MRIYLDNCCFNRPYDDQSQINISLETQAKLHIQDLIEQKKLELVTSFMLDYENSFNPHELRRKSIKDFLDNNETVYVSDARKTEIDQLTAEIMLTGVKYKDACHVACAVIADCEFFVSTDRRLLKYSNDRIKLLNPIELLRELETK